MSPIKISFDVTHVLPIRLTGNQPVSIVARVYLPNQLSKLRAIPAVITCLAGGSYDWRYFDVQIPGHDNYSQARYMAEQGNIVVIADHIGIGDSSRVANPWEANRHWVATANHEAMRQLYEQLESGEFCPELAPLAQFHKVGLGHSMGSMQTITQQALLRTYDAIAILGYTAQGVHLSFGGQLISADPGPISPDEPDYWQLDRSQTRESFHWDDVPEEVMQADDEMLVDVPTVLSKQAITGGIVTGDAKKITVPVYICLGQRDVSPAPYMEPYFYNQAPEVTLHILPKSGHCQSFASTRTQMWDRIDGWISSIFN